jgi:hypothetical protein
MPVARPALEDNTLADNQGFERGQEYCQTSKWTSNCAVRSAVFNRAGQATITEQP